MQNNNIYGIDNLFTSNTSKYVEVNNFSLVGIQQKNFVNGIQNARSILESLERSLLKTNKYEKRLMKCKATHSHQHDLNEWWQSDISDEKESNCIKTETTKSANPINLTESWSTMSIVCLQYQYEELSKRYETLLKAYNERCGALCARNAAVERLRMRTRTLHAQLVHAHRALLAIGDKYLALSNKRSVQKMYYEEKIKGLKNTVRDVIKATENVRVEMDAQLTRSMAIERDAATALLLAEIRKCNRTYLENLRLKAQIEELSPGLVTWHNY